MQTSGIFREKLEPEVETKPEQRETPNLVEELIDGATKDVDAVSEVPEQSELEKWEIRNGKYGQEYLGIKEIASEFPLKAQFGVIDQYIKSQLGKIGHNTPQGYQQLLDSIEQQIGSSKLGAYERVKRISEYIKVVQKMEALEEKKRMFL